MNICEEEDFNHGFGEFVSAPPIFKISVPKAFQMFRLYHLFQGGTPCSTKCRQSQETFAA